jgi:hypothetical protein
LGSNNKTDEGTMSAMSLKYFMFVVHQQSPFVGSILSQEIVRGCDVNPLVNKPDLRKIVGYSHVFELSNNRKSHENTATLTKLMI